MSQPLRTVFFGTSDIAVPSLEALANDPAFEVVAVVTQPDRPTGRKQELTAPPIKILALRLGFPVLQFERVKDDDAYTALAALQAPLAIVMSFGQIIPARVLDLYPLGTINVHPSILPHYRGASPITAAILNGDTETGVSIMKMDALMDHGPIYDVVRAAIEPQDTTETLSARLSHVSAKILLQTLHRAFLDGTLTPTEQDHANATVVGLFRREHGLLDLQKNAVTLERMIRAYTPWPGTYTTFQGKRLKIFSSRIGSTTELAAQTTFIEAGLPAVACGGKTSLLLTEVQLEGGTRLDGATFLRGHADWNNNQVGTV